MINLIEFLKLAKNTLERHKAGNYSYLVSDCDLCQKYGIRIWNCRNCPIYKHDTGCCIMMRTYRTDLRSEYWINVVQKVKNMIDVHGKTNRSVEISRDNLSKILWQIDSELSE